MTKLCLKCHFRPEIPKKSYCRECYREMSRDYARRRQFFDKMNYICYSGNKRIKVHKRTFQGFCESCKKTLSLKKVYWHHWNNEHPEWGIWVCYHCHCLITEYEKGKLNTYLQLRKEIENKE